jgi:1,4-dihydroxy-2-naphthoate octaprenyltransferase
MSNFMQSKDSSNTNSDSVTSTSTSKTKALTSSQIVMAESVQAEEVPTIPMGSLQTVSELQPDISVHSVAPKDSVVQPVPLVEQPPENKRSLSERLTIWWEGIRPGYLPLSLLPVVLGSVAAWTQSISLKTPRGEFHPFRFVITLVAVLLLQIGTNLVNDYYDYLSGIDISNSRGPGGLLQQGLVKPARVLSYGLAALVLGALAGAFVAISGGWLLVVFGLLGVLAAYFYSGPRRGLSSRALGELVSFCTFGPLLTLGAYMVQTGHLDRPVFIYSISLGLLATAFIHLNNMRDAESDAQAGKHTLASLLGLRMSRALYLIMVLGAYLPIAALALPRLAPHLLLLVLWTLPGLVIAVTGAVRADSPASLHVVMRQTLKLEVLFTLLLIVALVVTAIFPILLHILLPHLPALNLPF